MRRRAGSLLVLAWAGLLGIGAVAAATLLDGGPTPADGGSASVGGRPTPTDGAGVALLLPAVPAIGAAAGAATEAAPLAGPRVVGLVLTAVALVAATTGVRHGLRHSRLMERAVTLRRTAPRAGGPLQA